MWSNLPMEKKGNHINGASVKCCARVHVLQMYAERGLCTVLVILLERTLKVLEVLFANFWSGMCCHLV